MRVAYFSPFNPEKSGISDYSERLIPYLSGVCDCDLWTNGISLSNPELSGYQSYDCCKNRKTRRKLNEYDMILYNIGNNPHFHAQMYDIFLEYPGVVILHDYVLYFLVTGYHLQHKKDVQGYIREFYDNYGRPGLDEVKSLLRSFPNLLEYPNPEKFPLNKRLFIKAQGIIVHSESTRRLVLEQGYPADRVIRINHVDLKVTDIVLRREKASALKKKYGIEEGDLVVGAFGFIAPTKRNLETIQVINELSEEIDIPLKYLMVGEGDYVNNFLSDSIIKTGYVPLDEFEILLNLTDIVINLRYPSMGEVSGPLIRAMSSGKPCIVSDMAWFSELPDDGVVKISCRPEKEKKDLANRLRFLIESQEIRCEIGRKAQLYIEVHHNPKRIAQEIGAFLEYCRKPQTY